MFSQYFIRVGDVSEYFKRLGDVSRGRDARRWNAAVMRAKLSHSDPIYLFLLRGFGRPCTGQVVVASARLFAALGVSLQPFSLVGVPQRRHKKA